MTCKLLYNCPKLPKSNAEPKQPSCYIYSMYHIQYILCYVPYEDHYGLSCISDCQDSAGDAARSMGSMGLQASGPNKQSLGLNHVWTKGILGFLERALG